MNAPVQVKVINEIEPNQLQSKMIAVSEIFGPTIQGEGSLIGSQTVFVRTAGCDYRCAWCDTGYAVLEKYQGDWQVMDAASIMAEIETLSNHQSMWVTLSGGNPAMQELEPLINLGQEKGYRFSMESQGSIAKPWFALLDQLTLSPKPPSSGMSFKLRGLDRCLEACDKQVDVSLKFVVADQEDLVWAKNIAEQYPDIPCIVQPCNTQAKIEDEKESNNESIITGPEQQKQLLWLIEAVQSLDWKDVRVLPQLHTWLWGNKTGV